MKLIKKLISVLLVATMFFSVAYADVEPNYNDYLSDNISVNGVKPQASAKTFSDITDETLNNHVELLVSLGIIEKTDDGLYKPDDKVTRGDFAKAILGLINKKDSEGILSTNDFYDVEKDNPYYNTALICRTLGIINGFEDNTFRPYEPIIIQDAMTIIVKVLGYDVLAKAKTGYPYGYLSVASTLSILSGNVDINGDMTKAQMANYLYLTLEKNVYVMTEIGKDTTYKEGDTVLYKYHKAYKKTGVVTANNLSAMDGKKVNDNQVLINNTVYNTSNNIASAYLGYLVDYYYIDDDSGFYNLIFMCKNKRVEELTINAENIVSFDGKNIEYENGSSKTEKAQLAEINDVIFNGKHITDYNKSTFMIDTGNITLVSNDGDDTYDIAVINTFVNVVLSSLSNTDSSIIFKLMYNLKLIEINMYDRKVNLDLYDSTGTKLSAMESTNSYDANGKKQEYIALPSISPNTVLSVYADRFEVKGGRKVPASDATYYKIIINSKTCDGVIDEFSSAKDEMTINGTKYKISTSNYLSEENHKAEISMSATFAFDADGKIASFIIPDDSDETSEISFKYGYLIASALEGGIDQKLAMKIMLTDGTKNIYYAADKLLINDSYVKNMDEAFTTLMTTAKMINPKIKGTSQLIKYKINKSNRITAIETILQSIGLPYGADSDHLRRESEKQELLSKRYGDYMLYVNPYGDGDKGLVKYNKPLQYFQVPDEETGNDDDYDIFKVWMPDEDAKMVEVYDCYNVKQPNVAVIYEAVAEQKIFDYPVMVNKITHCINDDGEEVGKLSCCTGLANIELYGKTSNVFNGLKQGDVIDIYGRDKVVSKYVVEYSIDGLKDEILKPMKSANGTHREDIFEVYRIDKRILWLSKGEILPDTNHLRQYDRIFSWSTNTSVIKGGAILYDATDKNNIVIKLATPDDVKDAYNYGDDASIVIIKENYGEPRSIIVFNGIK